VASAGRSARTNRTSPEVQFDPTDPERFLETFVVGSWAEHLRQHEGATMADNDIKERARQFA
jgi:hypothetical protein